MRNVEFKMSFEAPRLDGQSVRGKVAGIRLLREALRDDEGRTLGLREAKLMVEHAMREDLVVRMTVAQYGTLMALLGALQDEGGHTGLRVRDARLQGAPERTFYDLTNGEGV